MNFLDWLGSFLVYRSPKEGEGFKRFLSTLSAKKLRALAGTTTHYSKKKLVELYFKKQCQPQNSK